MQILRKIKALYNNQHAYAISALVMYGFDVMDKADSEHRTSVTRGSLNLTQHRKTIKHIRDPDGSERTVGNSP